MKGFWVLRHPLFLLVVVSGVWLLLCFASSETALFPDSVEYLNSGREFARSGGLGELYRRPPLYPIVVGTFLRLLTGGGLRPLIFTQFVMVWLNLLAVFCLLRLLGFKCWWAALGAGLLLLDFYYLLFATAVLSEMLASLLFIFGLLVFFLFLKTGKLYVALAAALLLAMTSLTRAVFQLLPIVILTGVWIWQRVFAGFNDQEKRKVLLGTLLMVMVCFLIQGGWALRNKLKYDFFALTSTLGCNLTNHTGAVLYASEEHTLPEQALLDIYRRHCLQRRTHIMTIWYALEEMKSRTGLTEPQLCGVFFSLSMRAILHEPFTYVQSVAMAHQEFWGRRQLAYGDRKLRGFLTGTFPFLVPYRLFELFLGQQIWTGYLIMLGFYAAAVYWCWRWRRSPFRGQLGWLVLLSVAYLAVFSSGVELGENGRYRMPVEPVILMMMFAGLLSAVGKEKVYDPSLVESG